MGFEADIFQKYRPVPDRMSAYGFVREGTDLVFRGDILFGKFQGEFRWTGRDEPRLIVRDPDGMEYTLVHVENASGEYVRHVREACRAWLAGIRGRCFAEKLFCSGQAGRLADAVLERFGELPDDPWNGRYPGIGVFRRADSRKWYALIMNIDGGKVGRPGIRCDVLMLRAGEERIPELLRKKGFSTPYHMGRKNWIAAVLDDTVSDAELMNELSAARELLCAGMKQTMLPGVWLVPANPRYFDLEAAFARSDELLWKQSTAVRPGDLVYLYVGSPVSAVRYQCRVLETGIPYRFDNGQVRMAQVMKLRRLKTYPPERFPFASLSRYGIHAVRGPRKIPEELNSVLGGDASGTAVKSGKKKK